MHFSIIINTHNQYETFERCLKSCLKQTFKKNYEIIIIDTSDKKKNYSSKLFKSNKIKYLYLNKFSKYPEVNQIKKVFKGIQLAKGKWCCLLDSDDFFKKNKLKYIYNNYDLNKKIIIKNNCINYDEKKRINFYTKKKFYKNNFFFIRLINFWPIIYGTSCLSGNKKIFKSIFKKISLTKWNFLAIDALLFSIDLDIKYKPFLYLLYSNRELEYFLYLLNENLKKTKL